MMIEIEDQLAEQLEAVAKLRGLNVREHAQGILRQSLASGVSPVRAVYKSPTHDFGAHIEQPWMALAELESQDFIKLYSRK